MGIVCEISLPACHLGRQQSKGAIEADEEPSCATIALIMSAGASDAFAQNTQEAVPLLPKDYVLLTIFLKHDESKPLSEIQNELRQRNWMRDFPPRALRSSPGTS